jgi:hypothetical protein
MSLGRQIVRLMGAMILAIIASVASSAVEAHEGHTHHGHRPAATRTVAPAAAVSAPAEPAVRPGAPFRSVVALAPIVDSGARIGPVEEDRCAPGCRTRCCGTTACCVAGILSVPVVPPAAAFRSVALIPRDIAGRAGAGPEAPPEPPRTGA